MQMILLVSETGLPHHDEIVASMDGPKKVEDQRNAPAKKMYKDEILEYGRQLRQIADQK